jgi:hypothetical protein
MAWVSYESSGEITGVYDYTPDISFAEVSEMYSGKSFVQAGFDVNPETQYILDGEVGMRAALTATWNAETVPADGSEIVLSGLPVPCTVYIDEEAVLVDDGSLEFSAGVPGEYNVRVNEAAFLEKEWLINAI